MNKTNWISGSTLFLVLTLLISSAYATPPTVTLWADSPVQEKEEFDAHILVSDPDGDTITDIKWYQDGVLKYSDPPEEDVTFTASAVPKGKHETTTKIKVVVTDSSGESSPQEVTVKIVGRTKGQIQKKPGGWGATLWKGLGIGVAVIAIIKFILKSPGAFMEPITVPSGWSYETDGETYLLVYPPTQIYSYGLYGPITWNSVKEDYTVFYWETRDSGNNPIETGTFDLIGSVGGLLVPVDKFGLLAPYIGLTSTIIVATVAIAFSARRVKRREEKQ